MLETLKSEVLRQSKRILKKRKPSAEVYPDIERKLTEAYNNLTTFVAKDLLSPGNLFCFQACRIKTIKALKALQSRLAVPSLPGLLINKNLEGDEQNSEYPVTPSDEESEDSDRDSTDGKDDKKNNRTETGMEGTALVQTINSIITPYDGNWRVTRSFIDEIQLVQKLAKASEEGVAVQMILTRIKNPELCQLLRGNNTYSTLISAIRANVQGPDIKLLTTEIKALRDTSPNYITTLRELGQKLVLAYIYVDTPSAVAEKIVADTIVDTVKQHTFNQNLKQALMIGTFNKPEEVVNLILNFSSFSTPSTSQMVNYVHYRSGYRQYGNFRGKQRRFVNRHWQKHPKWRQQNNRRSYPSKNLKWTPSRSQ